MKLHPLIEEPKLEFGLGTHVCPRAGIAQYDVYDAKFVARRERILLGAVGTNEVLDKLEAWVEKCKRYIPAKPDAKQPNLFTSFCGFNSSIGFRSELVLEDEITRPLKRSEVGRIVKTENRERRVEEAVELYYRQVKFLSQNRNVDAVVCALPDELYAAVAHEESPAVEDELDEIDDERETNFRRLLKARCMHLGVPLQLVQEASLSPGAAGQQDDATKAWNFCTALYYKANQTVPWKLRSNPNRPPVCFVGIGFYRSRDRKSVNTSLAEVFDELGNSVILRGTPVDVGKDDRRPYLSEEQSFALLRKALYEYEVAMETSPGRLVIHKSSNFREEELDGMIQAAEEMRIGSTDFVTILDSNFRMFRHGKYPPYRGTHVEFERNHHLVYTRGAVEYYRTYPGLYVPQPLEVRLVEYEASPATICEEILALTKMNWNNTQFDGKYPITLQCARKVGEIMKYLSADENPQVSYGFYM